MGLLGGVKIVAKEEVERDLRKEKKRAKKEAKKARKKEKKSRTAAGSPSNSSGSDDDDDRGPRDGPSSMDPPAGPGDSQRSPPRHKPEGGREDWMGGGLDRALADDASKARDPKSSSQHKREAEATRAAKVAADRELNPFWKDGGDGKPTEHAEATRPKLAPGAALLTSGASGGVGDGGASWRLKALRRAKERAADEGKSLADVVGDRWGSVAQLVESIGDKVAPDKAHFQAKRDRDPNGARRRVLQMRRERALRARLPIDGNEAGPVGHAGARRRGRRGHREGGREGRRSVGIPRLRRIRGPPEDDGAEVSRELAGNFQWI